ncbi:hypothetical protein Btru_006940 [Bulinus truncatus]|nr:hypothetical protein Btru_006940 [Bulinus truncatus]
MLLIRLLHLSKPRRYIFLFGSVNFFFIAIYSLHSTPKLRNGYQSVLSRIGKSRVGEVGSELHISKLNSNVGVKLLRISNELNVSSSGRSDSIVYPANSIGDYVLLNPNLCKGVDVIDFIIIVHTAPSHLDKRERIRKSFARESTFLPFHIRVAFLLGRSRNGTLEEALRAEHATYNDSVMGDFVDDYNNLTFKGVMGYKFVSQHCRNSRFVLKIDDDVIVNTFKLLYDFYAHMSWTRSILCNFWGNNTMGILREGKWKVKQELFRNSYTFPYTYCSGFVVIISTDLVEPLYMAAMSTPFFWIDDVYLFGMLPYVVGGVTFYNYALDRNVSLSEEFTLKCLQQQGVRCPIFASLVQDQTFRPFWEKITELYATKSWNVATQLSLVGESDVTVLSVIGESVVTVCWGVSRDSLSVVGESDVKV